MRHYIVAAAVLLAALVPGSSFAAIPVSERQALLDLYNSTGGPNWNHNGLPTLGWGGAPGTECSWDYVSCDAGQTTVIELELGYNNLVGALPSSLGNLTGLVSFGIVGNGVTGAIPASIGNCSKLETLRLSYFDGNDFTGTLPAEMGNLSKLRELQLTGAPLTGPIPSSFAGLTNIEIFDVAYNDLTGPLPGFLFQRASLKELYLAGNDFTGGPIPTPIVMPALEILVLAGNRISGTIPPEIGQLTKLTRLDLENNELTGTIQSSMANLTGLTKLNLGRNALTGSLSVLMGLVQLEELSLSNNRFNGTIPGSIGNLTKLGRLYLSGNDLEGTIPGEIGDLKSLTILDLSSNNLTGAIPPQLGSLPLLSFLALSSNELTGGIPTELASATALRNLSLRDNLLNGTIPESTLAPLTNLEELNLRFNFFSGPLPESIGTLTKLEYVSVSNNQFGGTVPSGIWRLPALQSLYLNANRFDGPIPTDVGSLPVIEYLDLSSNNFSGTIPAEIGTRATLIELDFSGNRLSGAIPPQFGQLSKLTDLDLGGNELTGGIPPELGSLSKLVFLYLDRNHLSGSIPPQLGQLALLRKLHLRGNLLAGSIPPEIGQLTALDQLWVQENQIRGELPAQLMNMTGLDDGSSDFRYNALVTTNAALRAFINSKQGGGDFESFQTVAPTSLAIGGTTSTSVTLTWEPIAYQGGKGGYRVLASFTADGEYSAVTVTDDKRDRVWTVTGLISSRQYFFELATVTYPDVEQQNTIVSDPTPAVSATTLAPVPAPAQIVVVTLPNGILQDAGVGGGSDSYTLQNVGDLATTITLSQTGDFFTQSPQSFTLAGGATRTISLTGLARPEGTYDGESIPSGAGVPSGLRIAVRMLASVPITTGEPLAEALKNRVDVVAPAGTDPSGAISFINRGTAPVNGFLVADVAWLSPESGNVTIAPGATVSRQFDVERSLRPGQDGAATGRISLVYPRGTSSSRTPFDGPTSTSTVTIVDTVKPGVTAEGVPPLGSGEISILLPFIGHVTSGSGEYLTDVSISNIDSLNSLPAIRVYFTPVAVDPAQSNRTDVSPLGAGGSVLLADVVKNIFGIDGQLGTLQIRGSDLDKVVVGANVFNIADPRGTYGNTIPVFRSDRALAPGKSLWLTGLRKSSSTRTNLFVQEATGQSVSFEIEFFAADGTQVGSKLSNSAGAFRLTVLPDVVPAGAVAAMLTNLSSSEGRLVAYATPVDLTSGDTWSLVDWNLFFGTDPREVALVPIAGSIHGANNSFFRTDLAVTNSGTSTASGVLEYWSRNERVEREITLEPSQSIDVNDLVGSYFPARPESFGYVLVTPRSGALTVSSRTFSTAGTSSASFGMGVPTLTLSSALRAGQSKLISGLELSRPSTINAKKPGTFRTNVGLMEVDGKPARVKITVVFQELGQLAAASRVASFEYNIAPRGALLVTNLSDQIAALRPIGDLRGVQLHFQVISGDGAVVVFTASTDNGSGDQLLRIE